MNCQTENVQIIMGNDWNYGITADRLDPLATRIIEEVQRTKRDGKPYYDTAVFVHDFMVDQKRALVFNG